jgi:ferredoxin
VAGRERDGSRDGARGSVSGSTGTTSEGLVIEIDRELCYGFGDCVSSAPDVFELDDDEKATVIDPNGADRDDLVDAAANCPVTAITIREASTGEQIVP